MNKHYSLVDFMDLLLDTVCVVDGEGRFVFVSAACVSMFGYTPEEMVGLKMIDMVVPEDRSATLKTAEQVIAGKPISGFENRYRRKDGTIVHIGWSARWSAEEQLRIAVAHDITERKQAELKQQALYNISEAAQSADDLGTLFQEIHRIIGDLLPATNFFVALYDDETESLSFPYFVDEQDEQPESRPMDSGTLSAEVIRSGRPILLTPDTRITVSPDHTQVIGTDSLDWLGVPLKAHNRIIGALVVQSYNGDFRYTEQDQELLQFVSTQVASAILRTQLHERLRYAAGHDPLTGLANRGLFQDRLEGVLARVRREHARFALLYIDLDRFKKVNDDYGHATGDLLLQEVATRLRVCIRESDTVARVGGDEFVVLLDTILLPLHAVSVSRKINQALGEPFFIESKRLQISSSIGVSVYPEDGDDEKELMRHADEAMYYFKKQQA